MQINEAADVEKWASDRADEILQVLADVDQSSAPDRVVERVADLHAVAADLRDAARDAARAERGRETNF